MLDENWECEYFNDYVVWLEESLAILLKEDGIDIKNIDAIKNKIDGCKEKPCCTIYEKDDDIRYFTEKDYHDHHEKQAFLFTVDCFSNPNLLDSALDIAENNSSKIIISEKEEIKAMRSFMYEFLRQMGFDKKDLMNDDEFFENMVNEIYEELDSFGKTLPIGEHNFVPLEKYEQFYNEKLQKYEKYEYEIKEIINIIKPGKDGFTQNYEQFREEDKERVDFDATKFPTFVNNISILEKLYDFCDLYKTDL